MEPEERLRRLRAKRDRAMNEWISVLFGTYHPNPEQQLRRLRAVRRRLRALDRTIAETVARQS